MLPGCAAAPGPAASGFVPAGPGVGEMEIARPGSGAPGFLGPGPAIGDARCSWAGASPLARSRRGRVECAAEAAEEIVGGTLNSDSAGAADGIPHPGVNFAWPGRVASAVPAGRFFEGDGMPIRFRPDWVVGSNAELLARQRRTSTGFTWIGGVATGPTLAGVREEEERRLAVEARRTIERRRAAREAVA